MYHQVRKILIALLLALLLAPAAGRSEDKCAGAAREIDKLAKQIAEILEECADMVNNPCSKQKTEEVNAQAKPLIDKGVALSKDCFGAPDGDGSPSTSSGSGGAQ